MKATSVTKKGQVTIPKEIRMRLGIAPHDRVVFEVRDDAVVLRRATDDAVTDDMLRMLNEFTEQGTINGEKPSGDPRDFIGMWKDDPWVDEMVQEIYERRKQSGRQRRRRLGLD